jgi:hypothetical protein
MLVIAAMLPESQRGAYAGAVEGLAPATEARQ